MRLHGCSLGTKVLGQDILGSMCDPIVHVESHARGVKISIVEN